jgi:kynurenine formamidase
MTNLSFLRFGAAFLGVAISLSAVSADRREALADALATIKASKLVDLTHSFGPTTPVWSGFGQAAMTAAADPVTHQPFSIEKDGFQATFYSMVGQYGTHIDPPAHFLRDGATMDQIPIDQMILPLVVFDITGLLAKEPNHALSVDDVLAWEREYGRVPPGAFAALRTDMYKDWDDRPEHFKRSPFPAWSLPAVRFLVEERGVVAIGHESLDTDTTDKFDSESWLLKHGHYQIEGMANLDQVPPSGAILIASWPKVRHGFGFPARVIAVVP